MKLDRFLSRCMACLLPILGAGLVFVPGLLGSQANPLPGARLEVFPDSVLLTTTTDRQSLIVRLVEPDGITRDVTATATYVVEDSTVAAMDGNRIQPQADGQTQLRIAAADQSVTVPVTVNRFGEPRPISFTLDVVPALTRAGCNTGDCHGSARGQDGFHLSLFGYDPAGDYERITRELPGRRINLALPQESMLLEKSVGAVSHTGGKRFEPDSDLYGTILQWIEAGAPPDSADRASVNEVRIMPQDIVLEGANAEQRVAVIADYSDGTTRDVTHLARLISNNDRSAAIDETGLIGAGVRGEALIMARFDAFTVGTQVIVIPAGIDNYPAELPANNYIDELINAKLRKMRIVPSDLCSDEVFLRRVYLDIVGMLPSLEAYETFMADPATDKREKLVDALLERKEFYEVWVMKWAERLQIRSTDKVSYKSTLLYYNWLQDRLANGVPIDEIVRDLIASRGGTFSDPATNYYEIEQDTLKIAENAAQTFMGFRMQCAQCHNHPFDRWTMDDYYGFAAFFARVGRKQAEDPRERIVFDKGAGEVKHPVDQRVMTPTYLNRQPAELEGRNRREALADWLTSPDNQYFSQNVANFIWAHFFGRGIVDPVDDVRISNPPSNAHLLRELGRRLVEYDYDFKRLVRDICTSRTYQLATRTNDSNVDDLSNFSHAAVRRIRAEILLDVISQVTETPNKFQGLPLGAHAVQIADGNVSNYFLTTFGRAKRETVCTCEVVMEPNLSQALHLINGDTTTQRIKQGDVVKQMLDAGQPPERIVETLYLACLTRKPTAVEQKNIAAMIGDTEDKQQALEDVFWALLNSKEFMFNH